MLMYSPLSAYFDDIIPQQPALSNDGKQRQPALGDFTSPITILKLLVCLSRAQIFPRVLSREDQIAYGSRIVHRGFEKLPFAKKVGHAERKVMHDGKVVTVVYPKAIYREGIYEI
jgi:hypothetical protein